jgi:hypothetical protein
VAVEVYGSRSRPRPDALSVFFMTWYETGQIIKLSFTAVLLFLLNVRCANAFPLSLGNAMVSGRVSPMFLFNIIARELA